MAKITDTLYGIVSDPAGRRYALFFRSRETDGLLGLTTGVMARDEFGTIWRVSGVRKSGVFNRRLDVTLSHPGATTIEIELDRYWETDDDACMTALAMASSMKTAGLGDYMPQEMWIDLSAVSLERADDILRHG
jgi:hypothetical protein